LFDVKECLVTLGVPTAAILNPTGVSHKNASVSDTQDLCEKAFLFGQNIGLGTLLVMIVRLNG